MLRSCTNWPSLFGDYTHHYVTEPKDMQFKESNDYISGDEEIKESVGCVEDGDALELAVARCKNLDELHLKFCFSACCANVERTVQG